MDRKHLERLEREIELNSAVWHLLHSSLSWLKGSRMMAHAVHFIVAAYAGRQHAESWLNGSKRRNITADSDDRSPSIQGPVPSTWQTAAVPLIERDSLAVLRVKSAVKELCPDARSYVLAWIVKFYNDSGMLCSPQVSTQRRRVTIDGEDFWLVRARTS